VERCGAVITDPPYSERTHRNMRSGGTVAEGGGSSIGYGSIDKEGIWEVVNWWMPWCSFFVMFGDHLTVQWALEAMGDTGEAITYPPVAWVKTNGPPRFSGDGPACSVEFIAIGRRRGKVARRHRPGYYRGPIAGPKERTVTGTKPLWLCRALVRDYSEPGDLILDPFAGSAAIVLAAAMEHRRGVGAEICAETHAGALQKIAGMYNHDLFSGGALGSVHGGGDARRQGTQFHFAYPGLEGEDSPGRSEDGPAPSGDGVGAD
jgi:hypothetical protein